MAERSIALAVGVGALLAAAGRAAAAGAAGSNPGYHSPSEDDDYVEAHNYRRRLHGAGELIYDVNLAAEALAYAHQIKGNRCNTHSQEGIDSKVGENLAWESDHKVTRPISSQTVDVAQAGSASSATAAEHGQCGCEPPGRLATSVRRSHQLMPSLDGARPSAKRPLIGTSDASGGSAVVSVVPYEAGSEPWRWRPKNAVVRCHARSTAAWSCAP